MRPAAALLNWPHFLPFVLLALIGRQIQQEQGDEVAVQGTAGGEGGGAGRGAGGDEGGDAGGAEEQRMQAEDQAWILDICGNFKETRVLQIFVKNRFMRIND